jgi:hypothetical protein
LARPRSRSEEHDLRRVSLGLDAAPRNFSD